MLNKKIKKAKICFVMMPFQPELDEVYAEAIKSACIKAGFKPMRLDESKGPYNITKEIIERIFISDAIIADLTGWNPNVFYEMGVAHAIFNKTIMIIQSQERLPFDIHNYRCIQYEKTDVGLQKLVQEIFDLLNNFDVWRKKSTNPVQDFKPSIEYIEKSLLSKLQKELRQKERHIFNLESDLKKVKGALIRHLRSKPLNTLSVNVVKKMLKEKDLFHSAWNPGGRGIYHCYEVAKHFDSDIVFDSVTNLMWQKSGSPHPMTHCDAQMYISNMNSTRFKNCDDWRMPTLEEVISLMEREKKNGDLYIDRVFMAQQDLLWTADRTSTGLCWIVNLNHGWCDEQSADNYYFVRAVRHNNP